MCGEYENMCGKCENIHIRYHAVVYIRLSDTLYALCRRQCGECANTCGECENIHIRYHAVAHIRLSDTLHTLVGIGDGDCNKVATRERQVAARKRQVAARERRVAARESSARDRGNGGTGDGGREGATERVAGDGVAKSHRKCSRS